MTAQNQKNSSEILTPNDRTAFESAAPWLSAEERRWLREHMSKWLGVGSTTSFLPAAHPFVPSAQRSALSRSRSETVPAFFRNCLRVYQAVICDEISPVVGKAIYEDCLPGLGLEYHRSLGQAAQTTPHSFRTDESLSGKLYEIQVPGSGWGEYLLLSEYFSSLHGVKGVSATTTVSTYIDALRRALYTNDPCLLYLSDTSTGQTGVRYFIQRARAAGAHFYGWDPEVHAKHVTHIKSHSWRSLFTEHNAAEHLARAPHEPTLYDSSLNWMFYSKVMTALPFWRHTFEFFTDSDRALFPFTAILEPDGVQLSDGNLVGRREFIANYLQGKRYFLKYAGFDLHKGSGGNGVYVLEGDSPRTLARLKAAWDESAAGTTWILQHAVDDKGSSTMQTQSEVGKTSKLSVLCSFNTYLGSMVFTGTEPIVHAGTGAALNICTDPVDTSVLHRVRS